MPLPTNGKQSDSLAKLRSDHPEYGLLACTIAERFDPRAVVNADLATSVIVMLCRRLAENEAAALISFLHHLDKFHEIGALTLRDVQTLKASVKALSSET